LPHAAARAAPAALVDALTSSQRLGMLGDRPIAEVVEHAGAFVTALASVTGTVVDLGAGGGVPGLVIAARRPDLRVVLVDRRATRTDHVRRLVRRLGFSDRVDVLTAEAAALGGRNADGVVARGFGPPSVTLAAAAAVARVGGTIVVSEPPIRTPDRWPPQLLATCGVSVVVSPDPRVAVFRRDVPRET
jgi:16S rRNA (guanine527-N7)-methyltransferase